MDEDHNQDAGFVTDEVNSVIKVSPLCLRPKKLISMLFRTQLSWLLAVPNTRARKLTVG